MIRVRIIASLGPFQVVSEVLAIHGCANFHCQRLCIPAKVKINILTVYDTNASGSACLPIQ